MPPTPDVTEPQSGLRRFLGRFLAGTRDVFCNCSVPWQSREQGGRHGFRVFAPLAPRFAPKVVLLLIINNRRRGV